MQQQAYLKKRGRDILGPITNATVTYPTQILHERFQYRICTQGDPPLAGFQNVIQNEACSCLKEMEKTLQCTPTLLKMNVIQIAVSNPLLLSSHNTKWWLITGQENIWGQSETSQRFYDCHFQESLIFSLIPVLLLPFGLGPLGLWKGCFIFLRETHWSNVFSPPPPPLQSSNLN